LLQAADAAAASLSGGEMRTVFHTAARRKWIVQSAMVWEHLSQAGRPAVPKTGWRYDDLAFWFWNGKMGTEGRTLRS